MSIASIASRAGLLLQAVVLLSLAIYSCLFGLWFLGDAFEALWAPLIPAAFLLTAVSASGLCLIALRGARGESFGGRTYVRRFLKIGISASALAALAIACDLALSKRIHEYDFRVTDFLWPLLFTLVPVAHVVVAFRRSTEVDSEGQIARDLAQRGPRL
jgi:hypothetical protein